MVAALEAAWAGDEHAVAAVVRGEQPLAVLVAQYGGSRLQGIMLDVTGIADLEGDEQQEALNQLRQGLISHMTTTALSMMPAWALSAGEDVRVTGDLVRSVLEALLSFITDGDDLREVRALLDHLRADTLGETNPTLPVSRRCVESAGVPVGCPSARCRFPRRGAGGSEPVFST
ncbi:hypothetical protein [Streptomyces sp. NPDC006285]|uniref:hypothetical protein n=1 Tax=Streptomyces sp. NPDC006285 TaxID=3364742 RepID=UPI0036C322C8